MIRTDTDPEVINMLYSLEIIVITGALFLAVILSLALKGKTINKLISRFILLMGIIGLLLYGYGYSVVYADRPFMAVLKSLIAMIFMYIGRNEYSSISSTPLFEYPITQWLFWLVHFGAVYAFASTIIVNLGQSVLTYFRIILARFGRLTIMYGVDEHTLELGKNMAAGRGISLVYIGEASPAQKEKIHSMGGVLFSDDNKYIPTEKMLKSLSIRPGRKVTVYSLVANYADSIRFADTLMSEMEQIKCDPVDTRLVIRGFEDEIENRFQVLTDVKYGYGNVLIYDESMMAARELICQNPPAETLVFDETGRATEDFEALIVGFGCSGKAALHYLILNGMFEGSDFHADVFATDCDSVSGSILNHCPNLEDQFHVTFHNANAKSHEFFYYLQNHYKTLKYIVLCCGDEENDEISREISKYLRYNGRNLPVYSLTKTGYSSRKLHEAVPENWQLYSSGILFSNRTDRLAMAYNHYYCQGNGKSMDENWFSCDSFSRDSSRAAADFMDSMLMIVGSDEKTVLEKGLTLTPEQEENLARTEHLRWCAFHQMNGFKAMTEEEFHSRSQLYLEEKSRGETKLTRISKNIPARTHACLISWEELDELSKKENAVTGGSVDYKQADINNVHVIPEALKIAQEDPS